MMPFQGRTGTLWKALPAGDGYYHLTTMFMERQGLVIECDEGDKSKPHMVDKQAAGPGALWEFVLK